MSALRIGWIGLGAMGAPMAVCAAGAGFDVVAYDVDAERGAAIALQGATSAATAAEDADVLALMVATPEQVEDVLFGAAAAADALRPGAVVLVMAAVGPDAVGTWAARLAGRGVELVDAPVSGGVARAAAGELLVLAAGDAAALQRVRPLLDALADFVSLLFHLPRELIRAGLGRGGVRGGPEALGEARRRSPASRCRPAGQVAFVAASAAQRGCPRNRRAR